MSDVERIIVGRGMEAIRFGWSEESRELGGTIVGEHATELPFMRDGDTTDKDTRDRSLHC